MLKTIAVAAVLALASAGKGWEKVEWCAYPYEGYDRVVRRNGFVLVETGGQSRGQYWWSPVAKWDHDEGYYSGLKATLYVNKEYDEKFGDDFYSLKEVKIDGYMHRDEADEDSEAARTLVKVDLRHWDPVPFDTCFCTSPGNDQAGSPSRYYKNERCYERREDRVWSTPWEPQEGVIFDPEDAVHNCPKCERGLCRKAEEAPPRWTYMRQSEGTVYNLGTELGGEKCEIYSGIGPIAQFGTQGANAKNDYYGCSLWSRCNTDGYTKDYDWNYVIAPCCKYPYNFAPKNEYELQYLLKTYIKGDFKEYGFEYPDFSKGYSYAQESVEQSSSLEDVIASKLRRGE